MIFSFAFFISEVMDIRQYFEAVDFSKYSGTIKDAWRYSLGQSIENTTGKTTRENIQKLDVVIFSVPWYNRVWKNAKHNPTNKIREQLYFLSSINKKLKVADFGQLKKPKGEKGLLLALRDIIEYFNEIDVITVVIGGSQDITIGICEAFTSKPYFSLTSVDSILDVKKGREVSSSANFLTQIFKRNPRIFQFNLLGYQTHLVADELFLKTRGLSTHVRLGRLREDISGIEHVFRNSNVVSFDMNVLKSSEVQNISNGNPNGIYSEEACQIAKYSGLSNKLKVFGIFDTNCEKNNSEITFKLSAEIIWYFLEGCNNRTPKRNEMQENLLMYRVEVKEIDNPLVFYQCAETGKWWFEVDSLKREKLLIACSKKEYIKASGNEIPGIWLKYIQKIDEFSK